MTIWDRQTYISSKFAYCNIKRLISWDEDFHRLEGNCRQQGKPGCISCIGRNILVKTWIVLCFTEIHCCISHFSFSSCCVYLYFFWNSLGSCFCPSTFWSQVFLPVLSFNVSSAIPFTIKTVPICSFLNDLT